MGVFVRKFSRTALLYRILIFSFPYDEMKKAVEEKSAGELDLLCNTGSNKSKCDEMCL